MSDDPHGDPTHGAADKEPAVNSYVIDASMGCRNGLFCFCPVQMDDEGNATSIITGMNILGSPPKGSDVIGVYHPEGDKAAKSFVDEFYDEIKAVISSSAGGAQ